MKKVVNQRPILIDYWLESPEILELLYTKSERYPDRIATCLHISPELNLRDKVGELVYPYGGFFIFLVDRTGSMKGQRLSVTKQALRLLIKSLPKFSKVQIICYGSYFTFFKNQSTFFDYTDNFVEQILREIETY